MTTLDDEIPSLPDDPGAARFSEDLPPATPIKPKRTRRPSTRTAKDKSPRATSSRPRGPNKSQQIVQTVAAIHQLGGELMLPMVGKPATGALLAQQGTDAGQAWAALAARYPAVERIFSTGTDGMLWINLAMAYWPVVMLALSEKAGPPVIDPALAAAMAAGMPNAGPVGHADAA